MCLLYIRMRSLALADCAKDTRAGCKKTYVRINQATGSRHTPHLGVGGNLTFAGAACGGVDVNRGGGCIVCVLAVAVIVAIACGVLGTAGLLDRHGGGWG